jgi:hypothetical protein
MFSMRLHAPELGIDRKRALAQALTDAVTRLRPTVPAGECTVQFVPYRLDDVAVGGVLVFDSNEPAFILEVHGAAVDEGLGRELRALLARLLRVPGERVHVRAAPSAQRDAA